MMGSPASTAMGITASEPEMMRKSGGVLPWAFIEAGALDSATAAGSLASAWADPMVRHADIMQLAPRPDHVTIGRLRFSIWQGAYFRTRGKPVDGWFIRYTIAFSSAGSSSPSLFLSAKSNSACI